MNDSKLLLTAKRAAILKALIFLVATLVFLNLLGLFLSFGLGHDYVKGFVPKFNFDQENNVPTYFSSLLLLFSSCLLYWISIAGKRSNVRYASQWTVLSVIFFLMSLDETASIHELLIGPLRKEFNLTGILYFSWVIVGMVVVATLGAYFFRFLLALPKNIRSLFIIAGAFYVGGVIGFELIGGYMVEKYTGENLGYQIVVTIEETMEMAGLVIFINALLKYLLAQPSSLHIELDQ